MPEMIYEVPKNITGFKGEILVLSKLLWVFLGRILAILVTELLCKLSEALLGGSSVALLDWEIGIGRVLRAAGIW
jgi:hypothetical protein